MNWKRACFFICLFVGLIGNVYDHFVECEGDVQGLVQAQYSIDDCALLGASSGNDDDKVTGPLYVDKGFNGRARYNKTSAVHVSQFLIAWWNEGKAYTELLL